MFKALAPVCMRPFFAAMSRKQVRATCSLPDKSPVQSATGTSGHGRAHNPANNMPLPSAPASKTASRAPRSCVRESLEHWIRDSRWSSQHSDPAENHLFARIGHVAAPGLLHAFHESAGQILLAR